MSQPVRISREEGSELVHVTAPQAFAPFVTVNLVSPTAIPLGDWPEHLYAGRLMTLGERVMVELLPRVSPVGQLSL